MRTMKAKDLLATVESSSGVPREREFFLRGYRKALAVARARAVRFDMHGHGTEILPASEIDFLDLEALKCER